VAVAPGVVLAVVRLCFSSGRSKGLYCPDPELVAYAMDRATCVSGRGGCAVFSVAYVLQVYRVWE